MRSGREANSLIAGDPRLVEHTSPVDNDRRDCQVVEHVGQPLELGPRGKQNDRIGILNGLRQ